MWNTIMTTGKIKDECVAIIEVEVIGLNQRAKIEATLDTGFTDYLRCVYILSLKSPGSQCLSEFLSVR